MTNVKLTSSNFLIIYNVHFLPPTPSLSLSLSVFSLFYSQLYEIFSRLICFPDGFEYELISWTDCALHIVCLLL